MCDLLAASTMINDILIKLMKTTMKHNKGYDLLRRCIYVVETENYVVFDNLQCTHDKNKFVAYAL
jgi:hypothetical protein